MVRTKQTAKKSLAPPAKRLNAKRLLAKRQKANKANKSATLKQKRFRPGFLLKFFVLEGKKKIIKVNNIIKVIIIKVIRIPALFA